MSADVEKPAAGTAVIDADIIASRRRFIRSLSAAVPATAFGTVAPARTVTDARKATDAGQPLARLSAGESVVPGRHGAFASSFEWQGESIGPARVAFDKPLPAGLQGTLYRNGPARMARGDTHYRHWFDGDGMVHAFELRGTNLEHHGRMVRTSRYEREEQAGRFLHGGFGTGFDKTDAVRNPDDFNVANISVLPVRGELLALWEAGSPWRIDPRTLETRGRKVFSPETDGLSFSAHPRLDPDGRIWNFGYMTGSGKLALYDLDAQGRLQRAKLIDAPNAEMVHDFAITRRHLVFTLLPFEAREIDPAVPQAFMDRLAWNAGKPVIVLVVDKATLTVTRRFELASFFAFHFGNAWEDGDSIRVEVAQAPAFDTLMQKIILATTGEARGPTLPMEHALELTLDLRNGRSRIESLPVSGADFPRFDQRYTGLPTSRLLMIGYSSSVSTLSFGFDQVISLDRRRQSLSRFRYGDHHLAEEHVFVPRSNGGEGQGWVVGTVYDWQARRTSLSVFEAQAIADGPIATAHLPYRLRLGLHGQFVAA